MLLSKYSLTTLLATRSLFFDFYLEFLYNTCVGKKYTGDDPKTWLVGELKAYFQVDSKRQDLAEDQIEVAERDLGRPLTDMEARLVLANSGKFPEIDDDLRQRAISTAGLEIVIGRELDIPKRALMGKWMLRELIVGKNRKEGD